MIWIGIPLHFGLTKTGQSLKLVLRRNFWLSYLGIEPRRRRLPKLVSEWSQTKRVFVPSEDEHFTLLGRSFLPYTFPFFSDGHFSKDNSTRRVSSDLECVYSVRFFTVS